MKVSESGIEVERILILDELGFWGKYGQINFLIENVARNYT